MVVNETTMTALYLDKGDSLQIEDTMIWSRPMKLALEYMGIDATGLTSMAWKAEFNGVEKQGVYEPDWGGCGRIFVNQEMVSDIVSVISPLFPDPELDKCTPSAAATFCGTW